MGSPSGSVIHLGYSHSFPLRFPGEVWDSAQLLVIRFYLGIAFSCSGEQLHWCLCNKTLNTLFITSLVGHTPWYLVISQCALRIGSYSAPALSHSYQC